MYSEKVLQMLRQSWGLDADDTSLDDEFNGMGHEKALREIARWKQGTTIYQKDTLRIIQDLGGTIIWPKQQRQLVSLPDDHPADYSLLGDEDNE